MPPVIDKILKEVGLGEKERVVLSTLLQRGPLYVSSLAKATKINRTTAYGILKELANKGLVSSSQTEGANRFQSIAPEMLPAYVRRRKEALAGYEKELVDAVPLINILRARGDSVPRVQYFEGKDGVMAVYDDHIQTPAPYEMLGFADIEEISKFLPLSYFTKYCAEKERLGITTRGIFADNRTARRYETDIYGKVNPETKPAVRYISTEQFPFKGEITMYGADKVSIIQLRGDSSTAIVIQDKSYRDMMSIIFNLSWNQLGS